MKKFAEVALLSWWLFYGWLDTRFMLMPGVIGPFQTQKECEQASVLFTEMVQSLGTNKPKTINCKFLQS